MALEDFLYRARPWSITLVLHNWPIMLYSIAILGLAVRTYLRPSRRSLLALYGLWILALAYEYEKHGVSTAIETASYLFSASANPELRRLSQFVLLYALPSASRVVGIALLLLSVVLPARLDRRTDTAIGSKLDGRTADPGE